MKVKPFKVSTKLSLTTLPREKAQAYAERLIKQGWEGALYTYTGTFYRNGKEIVIHVSA